MSEELDNASSIMKDNRTRYCVPRWITCELLFIFILLILSQSATASECASTCGGSLPWLYNECDDLVPVNGQYDTTFQGDTSLYTSQYKTYSQVACPAGSDAGDFSLRFKPLFTGLYVFDTIGSTFDTTLTLIDCTATSQIIACDDDRGGQLTSLIQQRLLANYSYLVIVDGFSARDQGAFNLRVTSVPWPSEDVCPGIDLLGELPAAPGKTLKLLDSEFDSDRQIPISLCIPSLNHTDNTTSNFTSTSVSPVVTGFKAEAPGAYNFLVCPESYAIYPALCKNDTNASCPVASSSLWLDSGDFLSLVAFNTLDLNERIKEYTAYGSVNATNIYCNRCRDEISRKSPSTFAMRPEVEPSNNVTFLGGQYFFSSDTAASVRLAICGPQSGNVTVRRCDGSVVATQLIGVAMQFNSSKLELYLIQVSGATSDDRGFFQVRFLDAASTICQEEALGAEFNELSLKGFSGEIALVVFVFVLYLFMNLSSIWVWCTYGGRKEFMKSAAFTTFLLSLIGVIGFLYFLVGFSTSIPSPRIRDMVILWIALSSAGTAIVLYHVSLIDWPVAFGPGLFFRIDETAVRMRLLVSAFALCILFGLTVAGIALLARTEGLSAIFDFCAAKDGECTNVQLGTVMQRVYSRYSAMYNSSGGVITEAWTTDFVYESVSDPSMPFPCLPRDVDVQPFNVTSCTNTCLSVSGSPLYGNGLCNIPTDNCPRGSDCTDCGPVTTVVRRRLLRCNKSETLADFWQGSTILVTYAFLPFLSALLSVAAVLVVAVRLSSIASRPMSYSESSDDMTVEDQDGPQAPGQDGAAIDDDVENNQVILNINENI